MKILHVLYEIKYSGAEIMYADAASIFQKLGCELYAWNTAYSKGEYFHVLEQAGYKVSFFPAYEGRKNLLSRIRFWVRAYKYIKREQIDVVHIHTARLKWDMSMISHFAGCKTVYTFHNVFVSKGIRLIYNKWLRDSAKKMGCTFQSISDSVYDNELTLYGNKTIKIYNWYGNNRFYPAKDGEKEKIRRSLNIAPQALVVISVGGCSHIKRHHDIIKALPFLTKTYPDILYLHLGEGQTTDEEILLAKELKVFDKIRFVGNQNNVRMYLIASDIYLMPSKHEGIPITTIEAMACNIPSILYNVPGLKDFNNEMKCATIIPEDYNQLAKSIMDLYINPGEQANLCNNALQLVNSKYSMETNARKIFELYNYK